MKTDKTTVTVLVILLIFGFLTGLSYSASHKDFLLWEEKRARIENTQFDPQRSPFDTAMAFLSYMADHH